MFNPNLQVNWVILYISLKGIVIIVNILRNKHLLTFWQRQETADVKFKRLEHLLGREVLSRHCCVESWEVSDPYWGLKSRNEVKVQN